MFAYLHPALHNGGTNPFRVGPEKLLYLVVENNPLLCRWKTRSRKLTYKKNPEKKTTPRIWILEEEKNYYYDKPAFLTKGRLRIPVFSLLLVLPSNSSHMMADFVDDAVQQLLQQAEERLSSGRIVAKPKQAPTESKTAATTARPVGGDDANALLPPKQEKTEVRVPRPPVAASQRKGKVRLRPPLSNLHLCCFDIPSLSPRIAGMKMKASRKAQMTRDNVRLGPPSRGP